MMPLLALFLILLTAGERVSAWNNDWDQPLHFVCPGGQAVSRITSEHHNHYEDRRWLIGCKRAVSTFTDCYWTGYVNDWDQAFDFQCHHNYVMTGMDSYHDNHREDRRWQYLCCTGPGLSLSMCLKTPYLNEWDGYLSWQPPGHRDYVTGAASYHDNHREDRRWSFRYCTAN